MFLIPYSTLDKLSNDNAETTLQKSLVEDIKATEIFNDPAADTTPTFIRTCLPQNQDEGCSSDPNLNIFY